MSLGQSEEGGGWSCSGFPAASGSTTGSAPFVTESLKKQSNGVTGWRGYSLDITFSHATCSSRRTHVLPETRLQIIVEIRCK